MVPKKHFFMSHKDKDKGLYNVCFIAKNVKWLASSKDLNVRLIPKM